MNLYGLIGYPVKHSVSPAMHNTAFKKMGIEAKYELFEVPPDKLEDFILNRKDIKGFNITIPHKIEAKKIIDKHNPLVFPTDKAYIEISGAINTVKREGDRLRYKNTDPMGFRHSLEKDLGVKSIKGRNILVIGCGGAGRAIIADLSIPGNYVKKIYVYDKSSEAVDSAKKHFFNSPKIEFISREDIKDKIKESYLLVNASPVGMKDGDDDSVVDKSILALNKELLVYDVVYNRETGLIREAKKLGLSACDGRGMLAAQGAFSFSFWTGVEPIDVIDVMRRALDKELGSR